MHEQYDLVIIGTGSAATAAAYKCRSAGWRVAVVDYRPFGGTCALRGCDPKKVLIGAAELMDWIHNMQGRGAALEGARVDWPALMRFKRSFTGSMPQKVEEGFKGAGIDSFHGRARFTDGTALQLGDTTLKGRHVLIAAGARPTPLGIAGEVYAAGDAAASGGLPLTPVAGLEGGIAADNLLEGNRRRADYRGQPTVVFTIPPMASVGLQEEAAREQGLEFRVSQGDSSSWYTSRRVGQSHGGYKVLIGKEDDRILGAHLFGVHAEELINIFALAIRQGLRAGDLRETIYAYPTASYDITYML
jgi:pyruvate/2-oxoglutarate dehydrogenase complex dihydrolipoamide dehydrogenase (E3) component